MFIAANKRDTAAVVLNHIKNTFMCVDGDFNMHEGLKSANAADIEYWSYTNGWIVRAANQLGLLLKILVSQVINISWI